jgi:FdhD protein
MQAEKTEKLPITAAVLAGGRSMRMGVDKTLLDVDGRALVSRVCDAVAGVCESTIVVTNRPEGLADANLPAGVRIVRDEVAFQGPLGGLATALDEATSEWVLCVAADMPHLEPEIIRSLWSLRDEADAVVPVGEKGPEPLLALYRREACRKPAHDVLATGRRRIVAFFNLVKVAEVPLESLREADPGLRSLVNVNTPADLAEAREESSRGNRGPKKLEVVEVAPRRGRSMPAEMPVTVHVNDVEIATMQATPSDLEELAAGFLHAEGFLTDPSAITAIESDAKRGLVWVRTGEQVPDDVSERTRYLTSGCGKGVTFSSVGHARGLAPVESGLRIEGEAIYSLVRQLADAAAMYRDTGGMHAAGLGKSDKLLIAREDVGRHNAVDKVLGRAWLDGVSTDDAVVVATGRISYEMAVKAAKASVPIVASRSAVTDLAAELADSLGITLVGYARGGKLTVYTHPERILAPEGGRDA